MCSDVYRPPRHRGLDQPFQLCGLGSMLLALSPPPSLVAAAAQPPPSSRLFKRNSAGTRPESPAMLGDSCPVPGCKRLKNRSDRLSDRWSRPIYGVSCFSTYLSWRQIFKLGLAHTWVHLRIPLTIIWKTPMSPVTSLYTRMLLTICALLVLRTLVKQWIEKKRTWYPQTCASTQADDFVVHHSYLGGWSITNHRRTHKHV